MRKSAPEPAAQKAASAEAIPAEPDGKKLAKFAFNQRDLFDCYAKLLRTTDKKGKTVLQFAIRPDGSVQGVQILESTIDDADTTACIVDRVSKWKTPLRPSALKIFRYPVSIN